MRISSVQTVQAQAASAVARPAGPLRLPGRPEAVPPARPEAEEGATRAVAEGEGGPPAPREIRLPEFPRYVLSFQLDAELNRIVVRVIDPETKTVVRSIPPEEILAALKQLRDTRGALVDEKG